MSKLLLLVGGILLLVAFSLPFINRYLKYRGGRNMAQLVVKVISLGILGILCLIVGFLL